MDATREITELLFAYAERLDSGDLEAMASLFEHATYRIADSDLVLTGDVAVLEAQRSLVRMYDGSPRTHHNVTNVTVTVDDDTAKARARSYFTVLHAAPGEDPRVIVTGRYHDTFEKMSGRWRFTDRLIHLDQIGDLSAHLHLDRLDLG